MGNTKSAPLIVQDEVSVTSPPVSKAIPSTLHCLDIYEAMNYASDADIVSWTVPLVFSGGIAELPKYGHLILGFKAAGAVGATIEVSVGPLTYTLRIPGTGKIVPALSEISALPIPSLANEKLQVRLLESEDGDGVPEVEAIYAFAESVAKTKQQRPWKVTNDGRVYLAANGKLWKMDDVAPLPPATETDLLIVD